MNSKVVRLNGLQYLSGEKRHRILKTCSDLCEREGVELRDVIDVLLQHEEDLLVGFLHEYEREGREL